MLDVEIIEWIRKKREKAQEVKLMLDDPSYEWYRWKGTYEPNK